MNISDNSFLGDVNLPLRLSKTETGTAVTCDYYPNEIWEAEREQDAIRMAQQHLQVMASKRVQMARPKWMTEYAKEMPTKDNTEDVSE